MTVAFSGQVEMVMAQLVFDDPDNRFLIGCRKHCRIKIQVMIAQMIPAAGCFQPLIELCFMTERTIEAGQRNLFDQFL